jgi:hypothetical protein
VSGTQTADVAGPCGFARACLLGSARSLLIVAAHNAVEVASRGTRYAEFAADADVLLQRSGSDHETEHAFRIFCRAQSLGCVGVVGDGTVDGGFGLDDREYCLAVGPAGVALFHE